MFSSKPKIATIRPEEIRPIKDIALIVIGIAYLFWPFDIIPDLVPGLGWIDDLLVLAYMLAQVYQGNRPKAPRRRKKTGFIDAEAFPDPWDVLGIEQGASRHEIEQAYKEMLAKYHPDKVAHLGEEIQETAQRKTLEIRRAYEELKGG